MDEDGLLSYMKEKKYPLDKIKSYTNRIRRFEKYLSENEAGKSIKDLTIEDLQKYVEWCKASNINPYQEFFGIREYYNFLGIKTSSYSCNQVMQMIQLEKFKLREFMTANQEYAKKLAKIGIKTASQVLEVGKTKEKREILASKSGVPVDAVLKFVKLANLARCPGHMKKRACLYYEAGLDTFDKIAEQDPEAMITFLDDFIERTGFNGSAPTLADARSSVENSKRIPRTIEF
ncbi:MAG: DUF4332 domain-containing protein [Candidatus Bathyarchaeota archaeon]|nr:DUF4332 domain-containing protein [Candidatus Bathyarchaeota archaeon]